MCIRDRDGAVYCVGSGQPALLRDYIQKMAELTDYRNPGIGARPYPKGAVMNLCADIDSDVYKRQVVYPLLNRKMGSDQLGELLYLMGLVAILCPSVGQALNTSRLVVRRDYQVKNGDYNVLLLLFGGVGTAITLFVARDSMVSLPVIFWTAALLMTTIFRYYGDVEYRLNLNYKKYFYYYCVLDVYKRQVQQYTSEPLAAGCFCLQWYQRCF